MKATQLIGKKAIRTAPTKEHGDFSYTNSPVEIVAATDTHVLKKNVGRDKAIYGDGIQVLNLTFCDDNWTDYDELMGLVKPEPEPFRVVTTADFLHFTKVK